MIKTILSLCSAVIIAGCGTNTTEIQYEDRNITQFVDRNITEYITQECNDTELEEISLSGTHRWNGDTLFFDLIFDNNADESALLFQLVDDEDNGQWIDYSPRITEDNTFVTLKIKLDKVEVNTRHRLRIIDIRDEIKQIHEYHVWQEVSMYRLNEL